jgi:hypothetical protein
MGYEISSILDRGIALSAVMPLFVEKPGRPRRK